MKHILAMLLALLGASGALAQIYVKVVPEKKTFLSGEAMYMRLTPGWISMWSIPLRGRNSPSPNLPCFRLSRFLPA